MNRRYTNMFLHASEHVLRGSSVCASSSNVFVPNRDVVQGLFSSPALVVHDIFYGNLAISHQDILRRNWTFSFRLALLEKVLGKHLRQMSTHFRYFLFTLEIERNFKYF